MELHKALKVRIYPTEPQKLMIAKTIGCCRKAYNEALAKREKFYSENIKGKNLSKEEKKGIWKQFKVTSKVFRGEFDFMSEVGASCIDHSVADLDTAFKRFFKKEARYPRRHKRGRKESFADHGKEHVGLNLVERTVSVSRVRDIKFRCNKYPEWIYNGNPRLKRITISRCPSGKYYASLLFQVTVPEPVKEFSDPQKALGLDFSPSDMYIDSEGRSAAGDFGYVAQRQKLLRRLKMLQRRQSRKQKGSRNFAKAKIKVARLHEKIAFRREDWQQKESCRLVDSYQVIGVEDLSIKGLMRASRNAKNYEDAGWGSFVSKLEAKSIERNCMVVRVGRFFPSSKKCHVCGYKTDDLELSDRHWTCPQCGTRHDRDVNAAINIRNEAVRKVETKEAVFVPPKPPRNRFQKKAKPETAEAENVPGSDGEFKACGEHWPETNVPGGSASDGGASCGARKAGVSDEAGTTRLCNYSEKYLGFFSTFLISGLDPIRFEA